MGRLEKALEVALDAHKGQVDKGGSPYILHPIRVMLRCQTEDEQVVALLHDVVEDSEYGVGDILAIFGPETADAVDCLTKRNGEAYHEYLDRVAENSTAKAVKMHDIYENCDLSRLNRVPTPEDHKRRAKYQEAVGYLFSRPGTSHPDQCHMAEDER